MSDNWWILLSQFDHGKAQEQVMELFGKDGILIFLKKKVYFNFSGLKKILRGQIVKLALGL